MTRGTFVDTGDELVEVPWAEIEGKQKMSDGSWRFTLNGGPYHGYVIRVYPPCDTIVFPTEPPLVYKIHPPLRKGGKWVYIHDMLAETPKNSKPVTRKDNPFGSP